MKFNHNIKKEYLISREEMDISFYYFKYVLLYFYFFFVLFLLSSSLQTGGHPVGIPK